jgi:hypothetical protein
MRTIIRPFEQPCFLLALHSTLKLSLQYRPVNFSVGTYSSCCSSIQAVQCIFQDLWERRFCRFRLTLKFIFDSGCWISHLSDPCCKLTILFTPQLSLRTIGWQAHALQTPCPTHLQYSQTLPKDTFNGWIYQSECCSMELEMSCWQNTAALVYSPFRLLTISQTSFTHRTKALVTQFCQTPGFNQFCQMRGFRFLVELVDFGKAV